jgi:hypothetical protein
VAENAATSTVIYTAVTSDADGTLANRAVVYSLKAGVDDEAFLSIDSATGAVRLLDSADFEAKDSYSFTVVATNGDQVSEQAVVASVTDVVETSALTLTTPATASVAENAAYSAAAPTLGGTPIGAVTYTLSGTDAALFTINAATGAVSMIGRNFEAPADAGANNIYNYSVVATDADGNTASQAVVVMVTNVNDAPTGSVTITGTAEENQTLTANTSTVADDDGVGTLNYQWLRAGTAISAAINATYTLGDADVGQAISVRVSYTDGQGTVETLTSAATATVANVNDAPTGSVAITGTAEENQTLTANTSTVADDDGLGTLNYQWLRAGTAISAAINATYTLGDADVGQAISVRVSYTDGQGTIQTLTSAATATVANVNDAPTVANPIANQAAIEDAVFSFTVPASAFADVDLGDTLSYGATLTDGSALPSWLTFDATTRTFSGTPLNANVGTLSVRVTATDGDGLSVSDSFDIAVANVNDAPTVANAIADQIFVVGGAVDSFTFPANTFADVDANTTLTYSATLVGGAALPSWLTFDETARTFSGNPLVAGTTSVLVTASDGALSVTEAFDITSLVAPSLSTTLGGVTNLDVRSKIVLSVGESVTAAAGGTITLTDLGGVGFRGEATTRTQIIDVTDTARVQITGTGANTKIIIDPLHDFDLAANYQLDVSTGAFNGSSSSQPSSAFTSVSFSTVTPGLLASGAAAAVLSQKMNESTGLMATSLKWLDVTNPADDEAGYGIYSEFDAIAADFAFVLKDINSDIETIDLTDTFIQFNNFGANDLIYIDNQDNQDHPTDNLDVQDSQYWLTYNAFTRGDGSSVDPFGADFGGSLLASSINVVVDASVVLPTDQARVYSLLQLNANNWNNHSVMVTG